MTTSNNGETPSKKDSFWASFCRERLKNPTQFISMLIAGLSLILTSTALFFVYLQVTNVKSQIDAVHEQVKRLEASLDLQSYGAVNNQISELDKIFVDRPELRPFFYENRDWPTKKLLRDRLTSVAERKLDFIDFWFTSALHMNLKRYDMQSWKNYFQRSFMKSRVLCDVLTDEKDDYGEELRSIALKSGCTTVSPRDRKSLERLEKYFPARTIFVPGKF